MLLCYCRPQSSPSRCSWSRQPLGAPVSLMKPLHSESLPVLSGCRRLTCTHAEPEKVERGWGRVCGPHLTAELTGLLCLFVICVYGSSCFYNDSYFIFITFCSLLLVSKFFEHHPFTQEEVSSEGTTPVSEACPSLPPSDSTG